ncbi:hypothetical protein B566_EDAN000853 [Ephemera danica]|nr:hypothetical protein B566_EDAN000853 [Ephemera danica]
MVCVPCFLIPIFLFIWHRFIQPIVLAFWNPWKVEDKKDDPAADKLIHPATDNDTNSTASACPVSAMMSKTQNQNTKLKDE